MQKKHTFTLLSIIIFGISVYALFSLRLSLFYTEDSNIRIKNNAIAPEEAFNIPDRQNSIILANQPMNQPSGITSLMMQYDELLKEQLGKLGKTLKIVHVRKGAETEVPLKEGKLDIVVMGEIPSVSMASQGLLSIVALTKQSNNAVVSKNYFSLNELEGKTIACPALLSSSCYGLLRALNAVGIKENEIKLVQMDIDLMPDALDQGKIDAFCAWEPTPSLSLASYRTFNILNRTISSGYLCMSNDFLKNNIEAAKYITAAHIRAIRWMNSNRKNLYAVTDLAIKESMKYRRGSKLQASTGLYMTIIKNDLLELSDSAMINPEDMKDGGPLYEVFNYLKLRGGISPDSKWANVKKQMTIELLTEVSGNEELYQCNTFKYNLPKPENETGVIK